jgi:deoxyribose-phosphate aldolase
MISPENLAGCIDHTLLKAEATWAAVQKTIDEAIEHRFASVCINPVYVKGTANRLKDTGVKTCTVVGFPLGANDITVKCSEAVIALKHGADEIDFVAALPLLLDCDEAAATGEFRRIADDIRETRPDTVIKVIIESAALMATDDAALAERRIATACRAATTAGLDFVKTSTGFHPAGGATVEAVALMAKHAPTLKVKASGGIRTHDDAAKMIEAGAHRLGCSAGVAIVTGGQSNASY